MKLIRRITRREDQSLNSKDAAKERLHLVLMQDRANVSADFLELMKQEIIEVIKKYIDVDENAIDVRLTNKENADGTKGAPALYANIPITNIKDEGKQNTKTEINLESNSENGSQNKEEEEQKLNEEKLNKEETVNDVQVTDNNSEIEIKEKVEISNTENIE